MRAGCRASACRLWRPVSAHVHPPAWAQPPTLAEHLPLFRLLLLPGRQVDELDLPRIGPMFEHNPVFPARTNTGERTARSPWGPPRETAWGGRLFQPHSSALLGMPWGFVA